VFEYRQGEEVRDAFARHGVRYLFIAKSGAILLGYPDTTQDADVFLCEASYLDGADNRRLHVRHMLLPSRRVPGGGRGLSGMSSLIGVGDSGGPGGADGDEAIADRVFLGQAIDLPPAGVLAGRATIGIEQPPHFQNVAVPIEREGDVGELHPFDLPIRIAPRHPGASGGSGEPTHGGRTRAPGRGRGRDPRRWSRRPA